MLNNLIIGPPLAGGTDFRVGERAGNGEESDQFGEILSQNTAKGDKEKPVVFKREATDEQKARLKLNPDKPVKSKVHSRTERGEKEGIDQKAEPRTDQPVDKKLQVDKKEIETANPQQKHSREQVIQKFMDSFESEFGIPSTRLVEVMENLTPEQLRLPPEQTAELIISKLGLDQQDQERAQAMYVAMLLVLSKVETKPTPLMATNESVAIGKLAVDKNQLMKERTANLNQAVDQVNQNFWSVNSPKELISTQHLSSDPVARALMNERMNPVKGFASASASDSASASASAFVSDTDLSMSVESDVDSQIKSSDSQPTEGLSQSQLVSGNQQKQVASSLRNLPPHLQAQLKEVSQGTSLVAMAQKVAQEQLSQLSSADREKLSKIDLTELNNQNSSGTKSVTDLTEQLIQNLNGEIPMDDSQQSMSDQSSKQGQQNNSDFMFNSGQKSSKNDLQKKLIEKGIDSQETLKKLESLHQQLLSGDPLNQIQPLKDNGQNFSVGGASSFVMTPVEHEKNVQQILSQAQYLVKKGGGEIKVQMTPEGLGQVQLKVELQDGKVNVHVQAESPEVKKTIESSLAELKTSLAAHKLSMEHIKVDVVNSTSTDVSAQNQNQGQAGNGGQFERDQTRQFWQQFQQNFGNQNARSSFYEVGDTRNYGRKQPDPIEPMSSASQVRGQRIIEGRGQGLNVVA